MALVSRHPADAPTQPRSSGPGSRPSAHRGRLPTSLAPKPPRPRRSPSPGSARAGAPSEPVEVGHARASTVGASSLYITGVTIRASSVLDTRPPMITQASGEYSPLPCRAIGSRPPIAVRLVSTIGRNRTSPALRIAASRPIPSARSRLVRSTSRMDVLISMPISATNPIVAANERVCPTSSSARTPPATPSGMTDATISVERKVRNSSTRIASIANVATMMAPPAEALLTAFDLSRRYAAISERHRDAAEPVERLPRHAVGIVAGPHIGGDRDAARAVVALDLRHRTLEPDLGHLRERCQPPIRRGDVHPLKVRRTRSTAARQAHDDRPVVAVALPQAARLEPRETQPHGAVDLEHRDPEQPRLLAVDRHAQVGACHAHRIGHVLRARRRREQSLHPRRDGVERVERGALDPQGDRRVDWWAVLELTQGDFGTGVAGQLGAERVQETRCPPRLVAVEQHEQLADARVVGARRDVVVDPGVVMADRGVDRLHAR